MESNAKKEETDTKKAEATKVELNSNAKPFTPKVSQPVPAFYPCYYSPYSYYFAQQYSAEPAEEDLYADEKSGSEEEDEGMEELNEYYTQQTAYKDCPCCHGYVNACKGEVCKDLGQCYCITVKETEDDMKKPQEKK